MLEQRLIQRIQQGDRDALNSLIKEYYQSVFAYFYRNTRDYHKSNDLTQDVFIKVVSGIDKYDNRGRFKAWLFTVACNVLRNQWRHDTTYSLRINRVGRGRDGGPQRGGCEQNSS